MKLSAKAQYACVAMLELACRHGVRPPVRRKDIAAQHGISERFLVQILLELKGHGLVETTRGAAGGYQLAKAPADITLADIVYAIDQAPPALPAALTGLPATPAVQTIRSVLRDEQRRQEERLEEITLAELARQAQPHGELLYQI
ncbi:MAG: Rrf2 family transcriptional regulator [Gemmataceae bacterium]|nr:Rrf2 family transcriptional regulator [Gemmataceae bacterium]